MTAYVNITNDDIDRVLLYKYRPGTDLMSKLILTDNRVINMLVKALVPDVADDYYVATPADFANRKKADVLYVPHDPLSAFKPIFVEVQHHVDEKFFVRAIHHSTLVYERYKKLLIFSDNRSWQLPCVGWATQCLVLTASTLKVESDAELHPLQALGHFLCSQAVSLNTLSYGKNDKWMRLLYSIAHMNLQQLSGEEDEKLEAISNICSSSCAQLEKVKSCLETNVESSIEKAISYVDDTLAFLKRQKRKYCDAIKETPMEETPPLVFLNNRKVTEPVNDRDNNNVITSIIT